ncbi:MAG: hypothetical protein V4739_17495 [Pseudomonadota bacterium]
MSNAINIQVGLSMSETQAKIAIAISSAAEDLVSSADSLETAAGIVAIDLQDHLGEPKPLYDKIAKVKSDYAKLLLALEGYEAP